MKNETSCPMSVRATGWPGTLILANSPPVRLLQIGNLQALAQFLSNASKSVSGTLADILSPSRMIIFGTLLTTLNKPMFAGSGYIYATFGTVVTLYWVTAGALGD